jgi:hypothetical protein
MRLSHAGVESRAFPLKDGDILQLGVDYQGGTEEIYRCVKIRVEIGREWQAQPNAFKWVHFAVSPFGARKLMECYFLQHQRTGAITTAIKHCTPSSRSWRRGCGQNRHCLEIQSERERLLHLYVQLDFKSRMCDSASRSSSLPGLFPVTVCQALFIAPCSHSFHYKCIRGTLLEHHPGFSCPLCRSFHNLEADVEVELLEDTAGEQWEEPPEEVILTPTANINAASMANLNEEDDAVPVTGLPTGNANQTMLDDVDPGVESGMENIIVQGVNAGGPGLGLGRGSGPMRSVEDDLPFQTAAEDNGGRHLLPARLRDSSLRNNRRTVVHVAEPGPAHAPSLSLPDADSDGPNSGALAGVDTDMDLDEPVGVPHRTRRRSIYNGNGSGNAAGSGSGSGSSSNLPAHAHEYAPSSSFGAFDGPGQPHGGQPNLPPTDHLGSGSGGASSGGAGSGSRRVPVPAHLYAEAAEMGVFITPADENMSGGEATAEGNVTIAGTKRKR